MIHRDTTKTLVAPTEHREDELPDWIKNMRFEYYEDYEAAVRAYYDAVDRHVSTKAEGRT